MRAHATDFVIAELYSCDVVQELKGSSCAIRNQSGNLIRNIYYRKKRHEMCFCFGWLFQRNFLASCALSAKQKLNMHSIQQAKQLCGTKCSTELLVVGFYFVCVQGLQKYNLVVSKGKANAQQTPELSVGESCFEMCSQMWSGNGWVDAGLFLMRLCWLHIHEKTVLLCETPEGNVKKRKTQHGFQYTETLPIQFNCWVFERNTESLWQKWVNKANDRQYSSLGKKNSHPFHTTLPEHV